MKDEHAIECSCAHLATAMPRMYSIASVPVSFMHVFLPQSFLDVECASECACVRLAAAALRICLHERVHIFSPGFEYAIECGCAFVPQLRRACVPGEVCSGPISFCISVHMDVG